MSAAAALSPLAAALEPLFGAAVRLRDLWYRRFPGRARRLPCPVISVGNLTVGGTGKTPAVEWLCRMILERGGRPLIVSRGYGRRGAARNEEARVLAEALPDVPHVQGADRYPVAMEGISRHHPTCVVLDDGFQHRRLARDLDLVLVDATDPFGGGHLLPRGRLREPPSALSRAHAVILTRSDLVAPRDLADLAARVGALARAPVAHARHQPVDLAPLAGGAAQALSRISGAKVHLLSGIGNPEAFARSVRALGGVVAGETVFPDHHAYRAEDLARSARAAAAAGAIAILTTQKDAVKLRALPVPPAPPVWVLSVRFAVAGGDAAGVEAAIARALQGTAP